MTTDNIFLLCGILIGFLVRIIYEKLTYGYGEIGLIPNPTAKEGETPYILKIDTDWNNFGKNRKMIFKMSSRIKK